MTGRLHIDCEWSTPSGEPPEVAQTCGFVELKVGEEWATRCDNEFSGSVSNRALLSAYPLALWLASSWWRLRWEAAQQRVEPSLDWKMSHALPAAGGGFVWPALAIESDGESIEMTMHPSGHAPYEPLKYLGQFRAWVRANEFEVAVSRFVEKVLARLHDRQVFQTQLHEQWEELSSERANKEISEYRRLEAILGFDPGEASDGVVQRFRELQSSAGAAAAEEIAYASAGASKSDQLTSSIVESAGKAAPKGRFQIHPEDLPVSAVMARTHPWHRGYALADKLRTHCGWEETIVTDERISQLLGINASALEATAGGVSSALPFGIALRSLDESGDARFIFRSHAHVRRRFDAARMLADHLLAPPSDAWLPTTATHTARQKTQRAFAAELLCPNRELREFVGADTSDYRMEDAARHFGVAVETVKHQIVNHWR